MKPFEDILPEEEGNDLVDLLQEEHLTPLDLTPTEQEQITRQVRERLLQTSPDTLPDKEYEPGQVLIVPVSGPPATRRQRLVRLISSLVAILVIGVIITSALLLFIPQKTIMTGPPAGPVRASGTTSVQAGGFEMMLGITPGPYFISEMLEVNIVLTNHTSKTQRVGVPFGNGCGYAPGLSIKEDLQPAFELPPMDHSCPPGAGQHFQIAPGQTLSVHKYFVLQWSGNIILTSYVEFDTGTNGLTRPTQSPLEGHLPTLHIQVSPQVPQDRQLTAHVTAPRITVDAPAPARAHLQYLYDKSCTNDRTASNPMGDSYGTGNFGWEALRGTTLNLPGCSMKHITWDYAIGAPGYAVAFGKAQLDT
ncbi:hypothetical protein [Ktedonobacter robiniae]|uniref:DUF4352 domain-containing protein n=1 Tax=Ktedonobacter robiniae TaxID=2778365 RepID=A0ABQ3V7J9_9CHLR|nr:hypothetical protein [Ktedonobacter robiniae]GHO60943.1 hypothetical protein KSB_94180 [Ktedonobacter robiniae]